MAQLGKAGEELQTVVRLRSPAEEVFTIYRRTCHLFPAIMPSQVQRVNLINGGWESLSSERRWTFVDGNRGTWTDTVEAIIEQTKSITFVLREETVPRRLYNSLKATYQFTAQGGGCTATVVLKFDMNDRNADPNNYMNFVREMLQAVDGYLQGTRNQA